MPLTEYDIAAAIAQGPRRRGSDDDLNPEARRLALGIRRERPAAVLAALMPRAEGLGLLLTRRAGHLRHHAGQISLPGGKVEPEDAGPEAAALREAEEEIGLPPAAVRLLGRLDPYLTVTGFLVMPVVGVVERPFTPRLDPQEVDHLFEAPMDFLMDPANCARHSFERDGMRRHYYAMPWGEHYIWGATAGILKGLSDRLAAPAAAAAASAAAEREG
ncbi:hypothetical protein LNKW23_03350 [Paralimibaculum aggregatum]|uniref:Nudix hydrolase domain-containing protein n=1 Tax=Paralimibaculum aggregatum TaxID=3036245 RepID=A0ABQ6LCL2_9RHOB|nr:CoA pyrophosphatase [Limibaculum sp. NKW23]GMG81123.1 hypothetical protein LNKW23_03350 [Limibaculum sp. NKW23]